MVFKYTFGLMFLLLVAYPVFAGAGETPNWDIGYIFDGTEVVDGGTYDFPLVTAAWNRFLWPAFVQVHGGLARGKFQQATAGSVGTHYMGFAGTYDDIGGFGEAGDYYVAVWGFPTNLDDMGRTYDWLMYGTSTNPDAIPPENWGLIRFKVSPGGVDLYTQTESSFPSIALTQGWASRVYANGEGIGSCGEFIRGCGCALTSSVMVARYHGATTGIDGKDVNPLSLNVWLQENNGYNPGGGVNWNKIAKYTNYKIKFDTRDETPNNYALLDEFLAADRPVIARADYARGNAPQHFFVIDRKIGNTYQVKDPYWFNTKKLNEPIAITDYVNKIRPYQNGFDALRVFVPHDGTPYASLSVALGSPAEILITDSQGRRLGRDPVTGVEYDEIPGASYGKDDIGNAEDPSAPTPAHSGKVAYISDAESGEYNVQVIGTGAGSYTVETTYTDVNGDTDSDVHLGDTTEGAVEGIAITFDSQSAGNSHVAPGEKNPPLTTAIVNGTEGNPGWFRSAVSITLAATDESGISKTEYSWDGVNWSEYTGVLQRNTEGRATLRFRSIDGLGNKEDVHSTDIAIDLREPEVFFSFDTETRRLGVYADDRVDAEPSITVAPNRYEVSDDAGNMTVVSTEPITLKGIALGERLVSISRNGVVTTLPDNSIGYSFTERSGALRDFDGELRLGGNLVRTVAYTARTDQTKIATFDPPNKRKTGAMTLSGVAVVGFRESAGVLTPDFRQIPAH